MFLSLKYLKCWLGFHEWSGWSEDRTDQSFRSCRKCHLSEIRGVNASPTISTLIPEDNLVLAKLTDKDIEKIANLVVEKLKEAKDA